MTTHTELHPFPRAGSQTPDGIRSAWDGIANDFDRVTTPLTVRLGEQAAERAGVRPGMRVLDVAAGSGAFSIPAARRGAHVLATDISPVMIERLQARATADGLALEARVMDGHALDLENDTFDITASQNGVSLFPDLERGLSEMVRVTRPGGSVMIVCFGPLEHVEFLTFFMGALRAVTPDFNGLHTDGPPPPFRLADPEKLRALLEASGLCDVRVERAQWEMAFRSGRHLWEAVTSSNPIGRGLAAGLSAAQQDEVRYVLDAMLRERCGSAHSILRNAVNIGIGRK